MEIVLKNCLKPNPLSKCSLNCNTYLESRVNNVYISDDPSNHLLTLRRCRLTKPNQMLCFDVTMPVSDTLVNDWTWWLNSFFQSCAIIAMVRHFTDEQRAWIVARKLAKDTLANIQVCVLNWMKLKWFELQADYEHFWPMPTWGVTNAPPPGSKKTLRDLVKNFKLHKTARIGGRSARLEGMELWQFWPSRMLMMWVDRISQ